MPLFPTVGHGFTAFNSDRWWSFLRRNLMPEGQSCNIGFSKTSPRIERWLSKNNLGETTVQCWVFLGYRNLPGINLFILFPHLEVNAWQVRLLLSYLYLHLQGMNTGEIPLEVRLRAIHKEQTASRRSQPSSRIASKGELSFPWNLLRKWFTLVLHLYRSLVPRSLFLL